MTQRTLAAVYRHRLRTQLARVIGAALLLGCGQSSSNGESMADAGGLDGGSDAGALGCRENAALMPGASQLRINEAMSDNDGAALDELGESDDFIELTNAGSTAISSSAYDVRDASGVFLRLPSRTLEPGAQLMLWADGSPEQGPLHLPFKLDADGERIELVRHGTCEVVDRVDLPALPTSESYARLPDGDGDFALCHYATAGRPNGERCDPLPPPALSDFTFAPYEWPSPWPAPQGALQITELALHPADFVELLNVSEDEVVLAAFTLELAATAPGLALPERGEGTALSWPTDTPTLASGERVVLPVPASATAAFDGDPAFEGIATLFDAAGKTIDRRDFMHWPKGAVLARPDDDARPRFCRNATPGEATHPCDAVESRDVGDRVLGLQTPGDFEALAAGGVEVGQRAVKFVIDMDAGDTVHLLGSDRWPLHYTFVREEIDHEPALDRCDPKQAKEFYQGWTAFSSRAYTNLDTRRFMLGTLVAHASGLHTVELFPGDPLTAAQIKRLFIDVMARVDDPTQWAMRPADAAQVTLLRTLEGELPIVGPNAPFIGLDYQPLTQAVGFGELRFVPASELEDAELGPKVIVITDAVPNDIPLVGGLVTEAFQTPLAHVNVLSESRGTPNMALRDAHDDPRFAPLLGKLVRLQVEPLEPELREATPEEADAFYRMREPSGARIVPPLDASLRGVVPLQDRGLSDLPAIGAKAAQFAELYRVDELREDQLCPSSTLPLGVPRDAFAVPMAYYLEHFEASGARAKLEALLEDPEFRVDSTAHEAGLSSVREAIRTHPVDPALLLQVEDALTERFGGARVRFRSSSNTEDLPEFNGAGLHTSVSVERGDPELSIEDGLRTVWASLWNTRAFDERELGHIDQRGAAMAVLVHLAHQGEAAQGVAVSRDLLDPIRTDIFYLNAQRGEASVTNPAPGVSSEQLLYTLPPRAEVVDYQSGSSLTGGQAVLTLDEIRRVTCALGAVQEHFRPLLDPMQQDHLFAMQIEWKLMRDGSLVVKQARPLPLGSVELQSDCREF